MKKALFTLCIAGLSAFALQAQTPTSSKIKPGTDPAPKATTTQKETSNSKPVAPATTKSSSTPKPAATKATTGESTTKPATTKSTAATTEKASVTPAAAAPAVTKDFVKFDKSVNDYGTIKKGANGDCEFTYKNTGKEPLIISSCFGSCGCTVPKWSKEPLLPGQSETIKVHYDTNRPGAFEKTVTVNFQNHSEPIVLKIKGTVETPPAEVPFGSQPANTGAPLERNN